MNNIAIIPLEPGNYYHIYNRGNNGDRIFYQERNYQYFLDKYTLYLSPYVHTLAYCLLPNHFHLLIRVRSLMIPQSISELISDQFRKFFICFSMAINKQEGRTGSLMYKNFRRKKIIEPNYLLKAIHYIHRNPERHNLTADWQNYHWSSCRSSGNAQNSLIDQEELSRLFGDVEQYNEFHVHSHLYSDDNPWIIEDEERRVCKKS